MIVVLKPGLKQEEIRKVIERIESFGLKAHISEGKERTIIGAIGDERLMADQTLESFPGVEKVLPILKPYKLVSREFQKHNTIIEVSGREIGGKKIHVMAGPCSVESRDQVLESALPVKEAGATFLRGGAFKPRTSPYSFQGLGEEGLDYLMHARKITGLPIITEVLDPRDLDLVAR
jgi:3-deoxy-7-phosphoheptulonate synthase